MEYLNRYKALQVPVVQDDKVARWEAVKLGKYLLKTGEDKAREYFDRDHPDNWAMIEALGGSVMDHFRKQGATLTVHLSLAAVTHAQAFTNWRDLWYYARKALHGKGSPEEAQMTLQLAARFNLLKGGDLQSFCDKYLGLDCNGFVGNYLVHGLRGGDWDAEPPGTAFLADQTIDIIMGAKKSTITTVDDLVPASSYVMGLVGSSGNVIGRVESGTIGHVFITNPLEKRETDYTDDNRKTRKVWTMNAVESTGGVGLVSAACQFVGVSKDGIFQVKRLSHPHDDPLPFRACVAA
jgi:hypothetical protein